MYFPVATEILSKQSHSWQVETVKTSVMTRPFNSNTLSKPSIVSDIYIYIYIYHFTYYIEFCLTGHLSTIISLEIISLNNHVMSFFHSLFSHRLTFTFRKETPFISSKFLTSRVRRWFLVPFLFASHWHCCSTVSSMSDFVWLISPVATSAHSTELEGSNYKDTFFPKPDTSRITSTVCN